MRKVKFRKMIPAVYVYNDGTEVTTKTHRNNEWPTVKKGTGFYEPEFTSSGSFHSWGQDSDDGASYTVAIVEEDNTGTVHLVTVDRLLFINTPTIEDSQNKTYDQILIELKTIRPDLVRFFYSAGQLKPWVAVMANQLPEVGYYESNFEGFTDLMQLFQ